MALILPLCAHGWMDGSEAFYREAAAARATATPMYKTALSAPNAVCLDGTPGAYYFRPGTGDGVSKW